MKVERIETERLILRGVTADDLDAFYAYARKPNVGPSAGWKPHESREESLQILAMFLAGRDAVWAVVEKESGRLIGTAGLNHDFKRSLGEDEVRNLGYAYDDTAWGKGYGTEAAKAIVKYAFEEMHLMMVSAQHYPHNVASKRIIEKCGMTYEGTLRMSAKLYNGAIYDQLCYSITRMEYMALQSEGER